ncbi:extracellular fatty acid-binding protein-like [Podarcis raffonei]|uniref:extracellular fatty acid-binding protein-like n=1 Tax=Podarcis raffonei TaxID=65483 RepID=UPI00232906C4|nr:extracellular fatty acid-binding protein-like [Podarcis raffonei]
MKLFLFAVPLAFFCLVQGFSDDPQHREKAEGSWANAAIYSNDPKVQKHMEKMKMLKVDVTFEGEDVVVETRIPTPHGCRSFKMVFKRGEDGKYYHKCKFGEHKVEVIETDGQTYAIVDVITTRDGQTYQTSTLYVRDAESQPIGLLERFQQRSENRGFTPEQIKIFPKEMACQDEAVSIPNSGLSGWTFPILGNLRSILLDISHFGKCQV